ncbi:DUF2607 family protein [Zobellia alginiliquefaciens]|uniref:DUF2607 family protein n=1 Tax=Zobellia alginiliquefaciens TaxID=3032586 RepID=UPI0023E0F07F|nr:DUF2607 family protein [Zobellia alginiliquefaciens]
MENVKRFIAIFYVALMLLFKVAGLHALTHHAEEQDVQHCEVCDITTAVNFIPALETVPPVLPQKESFFSEQKITNTTYNIAFNNRHLASNLFARPPPRFS